MAKLVDGQEFIGFINSNSNPFCFVSFYPYFVPEVGEQVEVREFIISLSFNFVSKAFPFFFLFFCVQWCFASYPFGESLYFVWI